MTALYRVSQAFRVFLSALALIALAGDAHAGADPDQARSVLEFDVSEDATRFIFDETPMIQDKNGNDVPGDGNECLDILCTNQPQIARKC